MLQPSPSGPFAKSLRFSYETSNCVRTAAPKLPDFCAELSCCHSCLSDREAIKAKQRWAQAADSGPERRFLSPCKPKLGFHPLADATGKLKAFGMCSCMECYPLLAWSPVPWPRRSRMLCIHPASTATSYSGVADSRVRLPAFERGRSRTVCTYPQRCKTIQEKQPKHQAEVKIGRAHV